MGCCLRLTPSAIEICENIWLPRFLKNTPARLLRRALERTWLCPSPGGKGKGGQEGVLGQDQTATLLRKLAS